MTKTDKIEIRMSPEELAWLDKLIEGSGHNRSSYVRLLIKTNYNETFFINPSEMAGSSIQKLVLRQVEELKNAIQNERASVLP